MTKLTEWEQAILAYIRDCIMTDTAPPTYREIADKIDTSRNHVIAILAVLRREGYIVSEPHKPRGIRLTDKGRRA